MGISKRVSALLLAVLLSFGVCALDYLKVDALEVGGSVVWDTAINYLLGLLGLSPIAENGDKIVDFDSMRSKWVQDYEAYFYANVQPEDLPDGYTKERAYQNWIDNVCRGNLNTVEYGAWDIFKAWAETLVSENSGGDSGDVTLGSGTIRGLLYKYDNVTGEPWTNVLEFPVDLDETLNFICVVRNSDGTMYFCLSDSVVTGVDANSYYWSYFIANVTNMITYEKDKTSGNYKINSFTNPHGISFVPNGSSTSTIIFNKPFLADACLDTSITNTISNKQGCYDRIMACGDLTLDGSITVPSSSDYSAVNDKITDLQIINDYSTTTTQNVVSIDWDKIGAMISDAVGTVTGSLDRTITDALDDAQEKVAASTMSVANYNDYVTEISNTYVYDITNETSITNPDSTVTGVISGNVENAEFVLKGLQYVFPFCIPWDIKDFVTLLVADPVAPVIEYPIYNPVTDTDEIITIDFSLWENQVRIIRYIFDFLLIIGLLLLARSLIGAGGSD